MLALAIQKVIAWAPALAGQTLPERNSADFSLTWGERYLPQAISSIQSRRLSDLTKISVDMGLQISRGVIVDHLIFSSRHGELANSSELLRMLGRQEVLSPTLFSQSVHNTAVGTLSILQKSKAPALSLAAGKNSFMMGLVSAFVYLQENPQAQVLFISGDMPVPEDFAVNLREHNQPVVVALLLKHASKHAATSSEVRLNFASELVDFGAESALAAVSNPQALDFLSWFFSESPGAKIQGDRESWQVARC